MKPKVLIWDIETAPILSYVWGTFDQNIPINQIHTDWHLLAWAAKWRGDKRVMYMDQRNAADITNDRLILEGLWKLLDEADVVITQNGKKFDAKKVNARFIQHGMKPPSPYKHVDTLQLARKQFGFTSNKLAYMTDKLCIKYKKLDHGKFPGFSLWQECLKGNKKAWGEMEKYNKHDVLSLEELYDKLAPWDSGYNHNLYTDSSDLSCSCGNSDFRANGFSYSQVGKFRKFICNHCGATTKGKINLLSEEKKLSLKEGPGSWKIDLDRTCSQCSKKNALFVWDTRSSSTEKWRVLKCKHCGFRKNQGKEKVTSNLSPLPPKGPILKDCRCCRAVNSLKQISKVKSKSGYKRVYSCTSCGSNQKGKFVPSKRETR